MGQQSAPAHTSSNALRQLAHAHGVAVEFWGYDGAHRTVSDSTLRAVLTALEIPCADEGQITRSLEIARTRAWRQVLPESVTARVGRESEVYVHVPHGRAVSLRVELENGQAWQLGQKDNWVEPQAIDGELIGRATFSLPSNLPLGWHQLVAEVAGAASDDDAQRAGGQYRTSLIVVPEKLSVQSTLATERGWGMMAQLYSVRSRRSWGVGDTRDLREIASLCGDLGADFLLINPLHAAEPVAPLTPSPYLPVTRRFINPIYIRPEDIPEAAYLPGSTRSLVQWHADEVTPDSQENAPIDRDKSWEVKRAALQIIFDAGRSAARERAFARFRAAEGQGLEDFALWCALVEKYGSPLPAPLADIHSARVGLERHELAERVDFYAWLQWIVDEQLAAAQREARAAGMGIGLCTDLAVGVHPRGADVWSLPEAFATGVSVGAPADMYNQLGQNWSQPPWNPRQLAASGYAPLRDMVRTVLRHAGAVRIDHVMGLFRLWWIPEGQLASEGTYVSYDHEAMVGVILLEAQRAGAVVIGEDLGTVEPWVRSYLEERGVLGTSVMWFEKTENNQFRHPSEYRTHTLATVNTHDLPPAAGYLAGEHVDLRESLGLLTTDANQMRAAARAERDDIVGRLREYGLVGEDPSEREIIEAMHAYIAATPCPLLGISLTDAVGERRTQNQPGTDQEYPNWRIPLADGTEQVVLTEELADNARLHSLVEKVRAALGEDDRLRD